MDTVDIFIQQGFKEVEKRELYSAKWSEMIEYYNGKEWRMFVK
jgi:N-acetylglutamate synthase-like GNAT family acetyltransferase